VELETVVLMHLHRKSATSKRLSRKACDDIGRTHRPRVTIEGGVSVPRAHMIGQRHDATVRKRERKYKNPPDFTSNLLVVHLEQVLVAVQLGHIVITIGDDVQQFILGDVVHLRDVSTVRYRECVSVFDTRYRKEYTFLAVVTPELLLVCHEVADQIRVTGVQPFRGVQPWRCTPSAKTIAMKPRLCIDTSQVPYNNPGRLRR